jgi:pimeloyl-ACP methyl ester carboxylesterase
MNFCKCGLTILAGLLSAACSGDNNNNNNSNNDSDSDSDSGIPSARGDLVDTPIVRSTQSIAQIDQVTTDNGLQVLTGTAKCDVRVVQINYRTPGVQPGEMTNASAALLVPGGTDQGCQGPLPLIAFARGTNLEKAHTNAMDLTDPTAMLLLTFFASQGYAVVATDYLGYALSDYPYHPYIHADSEASAVIDSIRAARNAAPSLDLTLNGKVMVSGYSQGGHAAMATQRAIERDNADEFNLVAAAHLAGSYNVSEALIDGVANPILGVQYFVPFQITAWQKVYGDLYADADEVFNAPYDSLIEGLLPAVNYPDDLAELPGTATEPAVARDEIFQSAFLTDLATNPNNATIVAAKKQDLFGWNPKAPIKLCGGSGDPTVKFSINAQAIYDDFQSSGGADVSLVDVNPMIEAIYGSVLTDDPATYYKNYHGAYEAPLCSSEARKFFDQYK